MLLSFLQPVLDSESNLISGSLSRSLASVVLRVLVPTSLAVALLETSFLVSLFGSSSLNFIYPAGSVALQVPFKARLVSLEDCLAFGLFLVYVPAGHVLQVLIQEAYVHAM